MSEQEMIFRPTPWVGERDCGHKFLEILFSTLQESWGIQLYANLPEYYGADIFKDARNLAVNHVEFLKMLNEVPYDEFDDSWFDAGFYISMDELLHRELLLRSEILAKLNAQVATIYPDLDTWSRIAEALEYVSRIHVALIQRLKYFHERMSIIGEPGTTTTPATEVVSGSLNSAA